MPWEISNTLRLRQDSFISVGQCCPRISMLWNHIWLFSFDNQNALEYNFNRVWVATHALDARIHGVYAGVQTGPNEAILAAQSGLASIDSDARLTPAMEASGSFSDIVLTSEKRICAINNTRMTVQRFKRQHSAWLITKEIDIPKDKFSFTPNSLVSNSLAIKDGTIYVAIGDLSLVLVFDRTGTLTKMLDFGTHPTICSIDAHGTLLVVSQDNGGCVYWQNKDGHRTIMLSIKQPYHAQFQNENVLWVVTENTLYKCVTYTPSADKPIKQKSIHPPDMPPPAMKRSQHRSSTPPPATSPRPGKSSHRKVVSKSAYSTKQARGLGTSLDADDEDDAMGPESFMSF